MERIKGSAVFAALVIASVVAAGCSSDDASSGGATTVAFNTDSSAAATTAAPDTSVVAKPSRGFDGTTITVAGLGPATVFVGADIGAQARFKRFNDTNEIPGIKINFTEIADTKRDPAIAVSEARRLVTQTKVFAIVPDMSSENPGDYLASQHVPYVGWGVDATYCADTASTSVWGFGFQGCQTPTKPEFTPDYYSGVYKYVSEKSGKTTPTVVVAGNETAVGEIAQKAQEAAIVGAGFNVVFAKANLPISVSDYSPYIQQWIRSDNGKAPDLIMCGAAGQCLQIYPALKAAGFKGAFFTPLGRIDALAKALAGSVTYAFYNTQPSPGLTQLIADLNAIKPGTELSSFGNVPAYFGADMFIQALKKVGRNFTPEAVQAALANMTWEIPGLVGPIEYPASTVISTPACIETLIAKEDGSGFESIVPFACSRKQFKVTAGG
jgi:ABC-type branched-subunit amino acid transport system substrate-binding protein